MGGLNTSLLAIAALLILPAVGLAAVMFQRAGFDYMFSRGNPRARAQAHGQIEDIGKGLIMVLGGAAIAAVVVGVLHFG